MNVTPNRETQGDAPPAPARRITRVTLARLGLACCAAVLQLRLDFTPLGEQVNHYFLDFWFRQRGTVAPPDDVVIISMDEESYRVLELPLDQPWPRVLHAELLKRLKEYQVKRVIFDVVFAGASANPAADQALADAVALSPTVLGVDHGLREFEHYTSMEIIEPAEFLRQRAAATALVGLPEINGKVRGFLRPVGDMLEQFPSLAEAGAGVLDPKASLARLPDQNDLISFYGPSHTIKTIPYYQVLEREKPLPDGYLQGKVVYVGLMLRTGTGPEQKDSYLTPFAERGRTFGVEIHATAAANIMDQKWIRREAPQALTIALTALAFLGGLLIARLAPQWGAVAMLLTIGVWTSVASALLWRGYFMPGATWVWVTMPTVFVTSALVSYMLARRAFQQTRQAFQFYLAPEMVREVARNPEALKTGGKQVEATALFMDIADFTTICEQLSAQQVAAMLNAYFTEVGEVIFKFKGTLIKYIGDAIFVIWGAPIPDPKHRDLACQAALEIQETVKRFNATKKFPPLRTRIGINSGPMVVGNLGSKRRFDFTAIGDAVNLASRVEGTNKFFGTPIMISESSLPNALPDLQPLPMGKILVKGKVKAIELFALLLDPVSEQARSAWQAALAAYQRGDLDAAHDGFAGLMATAPALSRACSLYLEEISLLDSDKLPSSWTGAVKLVEK